VLVLGIAAAPLVTQRVFAALARRELAAAERVAVQNVGQAPLMAQVAASGLIVSFALTVSMVTMVSSFRVALEQWLDAVLPAPYYMRSKGLPLPAELLAALERPDAPFARVERMAVGTASLDPQRPPVAVLVRELDRADPSARLPFAGEVFTAPAGSIPVWISEPMQQLYRLQTGQTLRLPLLGREVEVFVGGVWRDYSRQFGAVVIAAADYRALGGRVEATDLALWPRRDGGDDAVAQRWVREQAARHGIDGVGSGEIRALSLDIFDKSFAVTYALEAAAMLIGLFGLAVTLAASVWLRARELATLSALGFDRAMLTRAVMLEGALIAAIGLAVGLACGIAVGAILTHVVNPQAFHWRMDLQIPWLQVLPGAALTLAAGIMASRFAARQATRLPAAQCWPTRNSRRPCDAAPSSSRPCCCRRSPWLTARRDLSRRQPRHAPGLPARPRRPSGIPYRMVVRHRRARHGAGRGRLPAHLLPQPSRHGRRPCVAHCRQARSSSPTPR
jgi:putative ABC transport system permease protein